MSGGMALHAIIEIRDPFFQMFVADFIPIVAIVTGILGKLVWMTGMAGIIIFSVVYGEGVRTVIICWTPTGSAMTISTTIPK
jgi:hypothetical protein